MWKDYENIKIKTVLQNELETPRITPLYVPKNPKPLYKRSVDEWKPFDILHFREFAESGEIEPEDVTNCNEFYSQITFLRNAVRNIDGTTSYQNLCKKPRSWSEPSVVDDQPGLIDGNRLHWQSASSSLPHPRMLLPLKPGPTTKWYAWRAAPPNKNSDKQKSKRKNRIDRHGAFLDAFSPRVAPHPTPAAIKVPESTPKSDNSRLRQVPRGGIPSDPAATSTAGGHKIENEENGLNVEPKGLTFITESKEESVDQAAQRQTDVHVSQETPKDNVGQEQDNNEADGADEQKMVKNEQSGDALKESGEPQSTSHGEDGATSTLHEDTDVATQEGEMENGAEESSPGEEQNNSDDSKSDQNPTNEDENDTHAGEETAEYNEVNDGDQGVSHEPESETDAIDEDILVPDTPIDVSENVEPATEDIIQGDGTPDNQNNDQEFLSDRETPGATDQPKVTDEVPEDAEEPQPSTGNEDLETGEKSGQPTDDGDHK
eukprot:XP_003731563.1 PREDICTED: uncharacterized protein DDB_G0290685 [Strongylocentrotus purpuratus]